MQQFCRLCRENVGEMLSLKELELDMCRLDLREEELRSDLEIKRMEEETKRQILFRELDLHQATSPVMSQPQDEFDVNRCLRMVPPFNDKDVDK